MHAPSKIGPRLAQFISSHQPAEYAHVYIRLTKSTSELLRQMNNNAGHLPAPDSADAATVFNTIKTQQQIVRSAISNNARGPVHEIVLNNTLYGRFTIRYIQESIVSLDDVKFVELVDSVPAEEFFSSAECLPTQQGTSNTPLSDPRTITEASEFSTRFSVTGKGVRIGLLDSGCYDHPELAGRFWDGGVDFPNHGKNFGDGDEKDTSDVLNHGTGCAGIIAGSKTGVAPQAEILILRIACLVDGHWEVSNVACWHAMDFAALNGCHICSLAGGKFGENELDMQQWREHADSLFQLGIPLIASAGKKGILADPDGPVDPTNPYQVPHNIPAPANQPSPWKHPAQTTGSGVSAVIAVSAIATAGVRWPKSGRGFAECNGYPYDKAAKKGLLKPDLCAPGGSVDTCSMVQNAMLQYRQEMNGTSPATAHVSGCLALLMQNPLSLATTPDKRKQLLERITEAIFSRCKPFDGLPANSKDNNVGTGLLQIMQAYKYGVDKLWW